MKSLAKRGRRRRCLLGFGWRVGYRCGLIGGSGEHLYHFFERGKVSFDEGRRVRVGGLESDDGWFSRRRFVVWEIFGGSDSGLAGDPTRSSDRWWRDVWSYSCSLHLSVQNKTKNQKAINLKVRKTQKKRKKTEWESFVKETGEDLGVEALKARASLPKLSSSILFLFSSILFLRHSS